MPSSNDSWNDLEWIQIRISECLALLKTIPNPSPECLALLKEQQARSLSTPTKRTNPLSFSSSSALLPSKDTIDDCEYYDLCFAEIYDQTSSTTMMEVVNPLGKHAAEPEQILTTDIPTDAAQLQVMDTTSAISNSASVPLIVPLLIATGAIPTLHLSTSATPFVYTTVMPTCHFLALPSVYPTIRSKLYGSPLLRETPLFIALPASTVYHKPAMDASTLFNITSSSPLRPFDPGKACSHILRQRRSC